ncbi:NAD(P)/FAD-dependent oxidoreductase [Thermococcus sp.]
MSGGTIIVGGGIGGVYTAINLIREGLPPEKITIIAREWPAYSRHRLAEFLSSKAPFGRIVLGLSKRLQGMGVEVLAGAEAVSLDTNGKTVRIRANGETPEVEYGNLVIATGGRPFLPPIKGVKLKGVVTFHGSKDVEFLKSLPRGSKTAVIGAGLVGLTAAVALRKLGHGVMVIEAREDILPNLLEEPLAKFVEEHLAGLGIQVLTSSLVEEVEGEEWVEGVRLKGGEELEAKAVVMATGVRPNSGLLREDGRPIEVDDAGRTGFPGVYALGDCAMSMDFVTGEFVYRPLGFVAGHYARLVARAIAGKPVADRGVIPAVYEAIGPVEVHAVGLGGAEAEKLGVLGDVKVDGGKNWREARIFDGEGRLIGWERVQSGHFHSVSSANAYLTIREAHKGES